jgi:NAD(P)-dependent dehydrogenase (short-subunit alcohol dehydrogenase family)
VTADKNELRQAPTTKGEQRVVILTGADGAVGRQIARALLSDGYRLALANYGLITDTELRACLDNQPDRAQAWQVDLAEETEMRWFVDEVVRHWGRVDALINMAGLKLFLPFEEMSTDTFRRVNAVNLTAPEVLCSLVVPLMRAQRSGRIINMSSRAGLEFYGSGTVYCASKAGLVGFSQALADALCGTGITVNVLCPPTIDTEEFRQEQPHADFRRLAKLEHITATIRELLRPEDKTTGAIFPYYTLRSYVKATYSALAQHLRWLTGLRRDVL